MSALNLNIVLNIENSFTGQQYIEMNDDGTVTVDEEDLDGVIPAGCAVILRGKGEYRFEPSEDNVYIDNNLLQGTDEEESIGKEDGCLYFYLSEINEQADCDWVYSDENEELVNQAHKAYLALPVEGYPELAETLGALENPHLQHTHGGCEICGQNTGVIVINMSDSFGDGWNGASITVKKDGEELDETVTIEDEDGTEATVTLVYDLDSRYTFYWNMGEADGECEFEIIIDREQVFYAKVNNFEFNEGIFFGTGDSYVVSFNANDGSGSMDDIETYESVTLPECTFTAPEGMMFKAWLVGEEEYQPEDEIVVTEDTEVIAVWTVFVPQIVIKMKDLDYDGWNGAYITVKKDGEELGTATVEEDFNTNTVTFTYDPTCEYTFYWTEGDYDNECSFEIRVNGKKEFEALQCESESGPESDCQYFEEGEPFFTLEATAIAEAKWGTSADALTEKGTLAEAFEAAYTYDEENETYISSEIRYIQLLSDVTSESGYVVNGGTFTLDLNGKTLQSNSHTLDFRSCEVTITDGSDDKTGGVVTTDEGCFAVLVYGGKVTIADGRYEAAYQAAVCVISGEAAINGGRFEFTDEGYCLLEVGGDAESSLTINGGTFNASNAECTLSVLNGGTATVKGGSFEGAIRSDVEYYGGTLIIGTAEGSENTPGFDPAGFSVTMRTAEAADINIPEDCFFFDNDCDVTATADFKENCVYTIADKTKGTFAIADDTDETPFEVTKPCMVNALTYTRTLPNLTWNALFVPFEIPVSQLTDKYDVAYINDVHSYDTNEDGTIDNMEMELIKIKSGTLKGNYPYLIRAKNEGSRQLEITVNNTPLYSTKESLCNSVYCSSAFTEFYICGTYEQMNKAALTEICESYDYGETRNGLVVTGDGWKSMAENAVLNPFRLYMVMITSNDSPVKVEQQALSRVRIRVQGEGGETGIEEVETSGGVLQPVVIHDLMGRPVARPQKGSIYVVNGKKVMWK